ncbi:MAG: VCBS domain-containing protein [Methylomonas sp.]|nr:VCBS domain-containing protein [Methylomonas sp.]
MKKNFPPVLLVLSLACSPSVMAAVVGWGSGLSNTDSGSGTDSTTTAPVANNDFVTITVDPTGENRSLTINLASNDVNCTSYQVDGSAAGQYGSLTSFGDTATYQFYQYVPAVDSLKTGQLLAESFSYICRSSSGQASSSAQINIQIIGNQSSDAVSDDAADEYENVDVEFNDDSTRATPLNSSLTIKGHLYSSTDRDWYSLASAGNEIIKIELCPGGSVCYDNRNWVVYVFDSDKLTPEMENSKYLFDRWIDDTGSYNDLHGDQRLSPPSFDSSHPSDPGYHMYLKYDKGAYEGALVGVIDPCFSSQTAKSRNTVEIGVGPGARNYLIAVSSPLKGDGSDEVCGQGEIVLKKPGLKVAGLDAEGKSKTYATTLEYITVFPYSDDQYAMRITGTGIHPLLSEQAQASSATFTLTAAAMNVASGSNFDSTIGRLTIPKLRVEQSLYQVELVQKQAGELNFTVAKLQLLQGESADSFQATYNPANQEVLIPRVTDTASGKAYSVVLKYHPDAEPWLETLRATLIE